MPLSLPTIPFVLHAKIIQHSQKIHNLRYFMHNHMPHTLNKANQPIKQPITTM